VWSMNVSMCEGVLRVHVHVSLVFAVSACSETITHRSYCIMRQYNDHTAVDLDGVIKIYSSGRRIFQKLLLC